MLLWQLPACHPATIGYAKIGSSRKAKLPFLHWRDGLAKRYCWLTIPLMRPFRGIRGGDPSEFQDAEGCCQVNPSQRSAIDGLKFALEKIQASSWRVKCSDCDPREGWRMVVFLFATTFSSLNDQLQLKISPMYTTTIPQNIPYVFVLLLRYVSIFPVFGGAI